ncbi:hypothetical protein FRZ03_26080 [Streptomyces misionensis]|uniref:DUF3558 domain-containing protein n=1 Tax=Streptomyces misionensis TaxID=67331 RepID=A0A5C6J625_9ACTN|nr:hypothetical protein [Streptomyces misionensis]TWV36123.1 hypothetical protein FRZ03_26080 [Streptomyces misionensis]
MASAVALVLVAAGVVVAVLRGGDGGGSAKRQSTFCWGTLKRDDVAALSAPSLDRYASEEGDLKGTGLAICQVGAGLDAHGAMKQPQFWLSVGAARDADVWATADKVAGVSPFRAPLAGVPGWVNKSMTGVLLPASCAGRLNVGGPAYVQLKTLGDQDRTWRDGALQKRMTDVLMTAAVTLTRQLGCAETSFKAPGTTPRLLEKHAPAAGRACGLPGFGVPAKYTEEYVTEGDFRLWSCALRAGSDEAHFTVTQDPYLVGLDDSGSTAWSATLECDGGKTLVQTGSEDEALARDFRAAVTRAAGCA